MRVAHYNDLLWHLHELWPELTLPGCALLSKKWTTRMGRCLARGEHTARVRIARDELRHLRELSHTVNAHLRLAARVAPQLLAEPGFGPLAAGKLIGEIAGVGRVSSDAKLAPAGGIATIPVSSGNTNRHRLDRGGNRQINTAIHRIAVTRARCHPETRDYLNRKRSEGNSTTEAIRCLKRHPARRSWHYSSRLTSTKEHRHHHQLLDIGAAKESSADGTRTCADRALCNSRHGKRQS